MGAADTRRAPDDFPRLVRQFASAGESHQAFSGAAGALYAVRRGLGRLLGWDRPDHGLGSRVPSLRDRLPADLRAAPRGPNPTIVPFTSVYLTDTEWVAESANQTVHAVAHIGWVPDGNGGYRGQMAMLVRPNGLFGKAYMTAIAPIRYLLIYPSVFSRIGRRWQALADHTQDS
nr:hypothetical protein GCM10020241_03070 [Streptoalloteichus tenebrarius]